MNLGDITLVVVICNWDKRPHLGNVGARVYILVSNYMILGFDQVSSLTRCPNSGVSFKKSSTVLELPLVTAVPSSTVGMHDSTNV